MNKKGSNGAKPANGVENGQSKKRPVNSSSAQTADSQKVARKKQSVSRPSKDSILADGIVSVLKKHASGNATVENKKKGLGLAVKDIPRLGAKMKLECFSVENVHDKVSQVLAEHDRVFVKHPNGEYTLGHSSGTLTDAAKKEANDDRGDLTKRLKSITRSIDYLNRQISLKEKEQRDVQQEKINLPENQTVISPIEQAVYIDPATLKQFEMREEEKIYTGDENNRKAMLEHRQAVQQRSKELEKARETYIKEYQERILKERRMHQAAQRAVDLKIDNLERALNGAYKKRQALRAEKENVMAKLNAFLGEKKKVFKAPQQYPMEDTKIQHPKIFSFTPEWLDAEEASRHTKLLTISDNLLLIGSRAFGTKVPSANVLCDMLVEEDETVYVIYRCLIELLIADEAGRKESSSRTGWSNAISDGCWEEIMRRYILRKDSNEISHEFQKPDNHTSLTASILTTESIDTLTVDQHISLLYYLTNTALLDTTVFRDALQLREAESADLKRSIKDLAKRGKKYEDKVNEAERKLLYKPHRRQPLGLDRASRRYWWGIGGNKEELLIESPDSGLIAIVSSEKDIDAVLSSLDARGIRESALLKALLSIKDTIILNIRRAISSSQLNNEDEEQMPVKKKEPVRQSSRQSKQVEFFDPSKSHRVDICDEKKEPVVRKQASSVQYADEISILHLPSSVKISYADAMATLVDIKRDAIRARISGPAGDESWEEWTTMVTHFGHEYGSTSYKSLTSQDILEILKQQTCTMEKVLNLKSKSLQKGTSQQSHDDVSSSSSEEEEEEEEDSVNQDDEYAMDSSFIHSDGLHDYESFGSKKNPKQSIFLWQTLKERTVWLSDLMSSQSPARLDLCIRILQLQSQPLLRKVTANKDLQ